ncbi:MAG: photosystem II cytochrome PsbV2 [Timaviella obliquedivisa GSE-PSE-MK23-08B]|jgi:photosystem II cytochrome c550|nr:photosystem II cytochrome PsbV2 [Timaviella obliquedivisa GSE-PSE-MK23-08B]
MLISLIWRRFWGRAIALATVFLFLGIPAAQADSLEAYVLRYLDVREPVPLAIDAQGETRPFSAADLSIGKRLFEDSCKNCHVGGATLPDPLVSLSLEALRGATPPRDNINSLVAYLRQPMSYDGTEESYGCRQISEKWMDQATLENLSAFVLRAAQKAPGWGIPSF